ncbi:hypothetical protein, partial [Aeromonas veronii]
VWSVTAVDVGGWVEQADTTFPEPPADGKRYGRLRAVDATVGGWSEIPAAGIADLTGATVAKFYVREALTATSGKWTEFTPGIAAPTDPTGLKKYIRTATAWEEFNVYTLSVQAVPVAAGTTAVDLRTNQVVLVDHTTNTNKVINFTNPPATGRAQT